MRAWKWSTSRLPLPAEYRYGLRQFPRAPMRPRRKRLGADLAVDGKFKIDFVRQNAEGRTLQVRERPQTIECAAPPCTHIHNFWYAGGVESRMSIVASGELVHGEFIEVRVLSGIQINLISSCAIESKIQSESITLSAASRALALWRPSLWNTTCNERVARVLNIFPDRDHLIEVGRIASELIKIQRTPD